MMARTFLITGVSSGFGYEMTKQLLERGDRVIGTVRSTKKVESLKEKYPDTFDCRILDVTDVPAVQQLVKDSFTQYGRIDVVISNAGYGCSAVWKNFRTRKSITSSQRIWLVRSSCSRPQCLLCANRAAVG